MKTMKYVIIDGYLNELPVLFPGEVSHDVVAASLSSMGAVVAAGFVDLVAGEVSAHGNSHSLKIGSRPQDSVIIEQYLAG